MRRLAASIIAYSGGETRSPDVRRSLQGLPAFQYERIDEKTVDIRWKKPLQWEQKMRHVTEQEEKTDGNLQDPARAFYDLVQHGG